MDAAVRDFIVRLHSAPLQYVLAVTGGGAGAAAWLLSTPGGSRTVLEIAIPYGEQALADYLGRRPSAFCSQETSERLAARALERARWLAHGPGPASAVAGLGCTASLRSDRPKRGDHRFYVSVQTLTSTTTYSLTLTKEARSREEEENVVDRVILNALAEAAGSPDRLNLTLLPGEQIIRSDEPEETVFTTFLKAQAPSVCIETDGRYRTDGPRPTLILSGSFNPLHEGHQKLAHAAAQLTGRQPAYELPIVNADKPPLTAEEVRRRARQFTWRAPLWLTRAPTFPEKSALFPGATFVVGVDTAVRILDPRFYGDAAARDAALSAFAAAACRFLVAGRVDGAGRFLGLEHLSMTSSHAELFTGIPEETFRVDVSSTELRKLAATAVSLK